MEPLQLALLRVVQDSFQLGIITALLSENNIPYILKDQGAGGYMRIIGGQSLYGTEILVEESFFEKANEIVNTIYPNED
ncbi:MAG: DUF2007 domain-containing protein [Tissierellaceae bacterium]|nr:DUF2007 domain-containing protein [Tissierellaceae bacterium]